jgi:hypothetical protein
MAKGLEKVTEVRLQISVMELVLDGWMIGWCKLKMV